MSNSSITQIYTEGGSVINGNVTVSDGDFIGGNKNVYFTNEAAYDVIGLPNPYLGLRSFTYAEHALYTGRDHEIEEAVKKLTDPGNQQALLFITGASGCGKSSFVQAGLLPALEMYYNKRRFSVSHCVFRPSLHPMAMLKDALLQLGIEASTPILITPTSQVNLLVIDQFEETFTQSDHTERAAFFQWLEDLLPFEKSHTHIMVTIRSDYLNDLVEITSLWQYAKNAIVLRSMSENALKATIQYPLQVRYPNGDKRFEKELVEKLACDASRDPALLPLLQVTLEEIWRKGRLTLASYNNLTDALKQRADQVVEFEDYNLPIPQIQRSTAKQTEILNLLLDLVKVSLDDDTQRGIRVSRSIEALSTPHGGNLLLIESKRLINDLVNARLLSVVIESDVETVNIIHEALIRNWDRLQNAIAERREELQQRTRFEQSLHEWIAHDYDAQYLLQGIHLAEADKLAKDGDIVLRNSTAKDLLQRSMEQAESEQRTQLALAEARVKAERKTVVRTQLLLLIAIAFIIFLATPSAYRMFLRWNAGRLGKLISIPTSTASLGYTPTNLDYASNYLPERKYVIPAFQIEKYEVTNQRYNLCVSADACFPPNALPSEYASSERSDFPVVNITALQAKQFCEWIGRRLPTEVEWERAARYNDQRLWPWSSATKSVENTSQFANFQTGLEAGELKSVGSYPAGASAEKVEDLAGNAWEFTESRVEDVTNELKTESSTEPKQVLVSYNIRGGGADIPADLVEAVIASRTDTQATFPQEYFGFRCATN